MRWIPASVLFASIALATVPYTFPAGVPAKASQVNRNFAALDSVLEAQVERLVELREALATQADSLRRELAEMRRKNRSDSLSLVERIDRSIAADTGWMAGQIPKGAVMGLCAVADLDGFLPGSNRSWQLLDSSTVVEAEKSSIASAGSTPRPDTLAGRAPSDSSHAGLALPGSVKPALRWFVKVK